MNMKRGLVLSLVALAGMASSAMAQNVQLSLNLRYTDPADPSEGGVWYLVAKTDDPEGIAGISAYISNIVAGTANSSYGNGANAGSASYAATTAATIAAITNGGVPYKDTFGGVENIVYGQNIATGGTVIADVGQGAGTPGNTAIDPLRNPAWNNAAIIANGTFAGGGALANQFNRPAFAPSGANVTDANTLAATTPGTTPAQNANTTFVVRGDNLITFNFNTVAGSGLRPGDANRDGLVNQFDVSTLAGNFGPATGKGWDQADFNDDGVVNQFDVSALAGNFGQPAPPAPVAAIPEPSSIALLAFGLLALGRGVKRS
jgi:hypothetical protein